MADAPIQMPPKQVSEPTRGRTVDLRTACLMALALVLSGLILMQGSKLAGPATAKADVVATAGSMTSLTATAGSSDILLVIDGRSETLLVYRVENQNSVDLYNKYNLPRLFADARGRGVPGVRGPAGGNPGGLVPGGSSGSTGSPR
jgi:hypothetical protein